MRLLLLTRYYPPEISGGARRPKALVDGLRAAGIDVTLCGPSLIEDPQLIPVPHPSFPAIQGNRGPAASIPPSAAMMNWARRHLLLPDPEIRWALRAVAAVKASGHSFDWIMTTNPPESLHVAGAMLKKHLGCHWVGDVRDMWIERPQRRELEGSVLRRWVETVIAKATLGKADAIVAVSQAVLNEALNYARADVPSAIIGHFATPFTGKAEQLPNETFNIVHTGAISLSNPLTQFEALLTDFESLAQKRSDAVLWLAGNLSDAERQALSKSEFSPQIRVLGPVNMERARALQMGADALALVSGRASHALPGKFSEYIQTGKPILISAPGPWLQLIPPGAPVVPFETAVTMTKSIASPSPSVFDAAAAVSQLLDLLNKVTRPNS
jgi:glycosyltransferase involved in cell wall biosynthesis